MSGRRAAVGAGAVGGLLVLLSLGAFPGVPALAGVRADDDPRSSAAVRAERRAYDGAPPVIPHAPVGTGCTACHGDHAVVVPDLGLSPPSPHARTAGLGDAARCVQCHVYRATDEVFVASTFEGLRQDLRRGARLHPWAPPVLPHPRFLRENCRACHAGPAAREPIRTTHPERERCDQCHVPQQGAVPFER